MPRGDGGGPGAAPPPGDAALSRARALVMRWGWNAAAYQILNPGIDLWFSAAGDAVAGFVETPGYRVVAGAPASPVHRLRAVAAELEAETRALGRRVCYFAAGHRLEELLRGSPTHSRVLLGAQPVWDAGGWPDVMAAHASLRAQLNRARNKGIKVEEWPAERAGRSAELPRCLEEWLGTRGLPPLHFMVEPAILERLLDRRVFVAQRGGTPVGFVVASPVPARRGWLIEQWVRGRGAPNGTTELMIDAAMRSLAADGARYVTLGLSPLSRHVPGDAAPNPAWLRLALGWVRAHGNRFYNFQGLDSFKAKLRPQGWEPIYAISATRTFSPRTLYAIASAFSAGSPVALLGGSLARAALQEARWMTSRRPG
jgi:phosphatidylglycerol lysyltransferase